MNDSAWSSNAARAKGMRRIAVLQLGTADCGFDQVEFTKKLALFTVKAILPIALSAAGLQSHADFCSKVTTLEEAAAAWSAESAAAEAAAWSAESAAAAAAESADEVLASFAVGVENILIGMDVPAVKFLKLLHA